MSRLGPHGSGVYHPSQIIKPDWRELRECGPIPCQQQLTVDLPHSLSDPKPKPTLLQVVQKRGQPEVTPVPFINPDPIACLVGCSNEAPVIVDWQENMALIDSGAQVSSVSSQFCEELALEVQPLGQLLELEGMGVLPSLTLGSWRSTSRSQGSNIIMRMCYHWLYHPLPILKWS